MDALLDRPEIKQPAPPDWSDSDRELKEKYNLDVYSYEVWRAEDGIGTAVAYKHVPHNRNPDGFHELPSEPAVLHGQAEMLEGVLESPWGPAFHSMGFETHRSHYQTDKENTEAIAMSFPKADIGNNTMAQLEPDDERPNVTFVSCKEQYSRLGMIELLARGEVAIAEEEWEGAHDSIFHIPAWLLMPKAVQTHLVAEAQALLAAKESLGFDPDTYDRRDANLRSFDAALTNFLQKIDNTINTNRSLGITDAILASSDESGSFQMQENKNIPPEDVLRRKYHELLRTSAYAKSLEEPDIDEVINATITRARALRDLAPAA